MLGTIAHLSPSACLFLFHIQKRQFIRYIFHEVRVPFNAIVLGFEQLELDLREHASLLPGALETLGIISEQSNVVTRILNDVLSMQKIEDGALTLDIDVFNIERMIQNALYAFRSTCKEKQIKVRVLLASIDEIVAKALPALKIGQLIKPEMDTISEDPSHPSSSPTKNGTADAAAKTRRQPTVELDERHFSRSSAPPSTRHGRARHARARQAYMHRAYVRGDQYRLRQVFSNLITNA